MITAGRDPTTPTGQQAPEPCPDRRDNPRPLARTLARVPGLIWLIVALNLGVALCQTALFPNLAHPDERMHIDLIAQVAQGSAWPWPAPGTLNATQGSRAADVRPPGLRDLTSAPAPAWSKRPSYLATGGSDSTGQPLNHLVQHPPAYYLLSAGALVLIAHWQHAPFGLVMLLLRYANGVLCLALPLLLWAAARRLALPNPLPVVAALVPLAIPNLSSEQTSINNDNLLLVLFAAITLLITRVLTGDTSRRTALLIGALSTLALLTKGFALVIPGWVGAAYLVAALQQRTARRLWSAAVGLLIAWSASLPGLAWWLHNKLAYGIVQPNGLYRDPVPLAAQRPWSDGGWEFMVRNLILMGNNFFGTTHGLLPWLAWLAGGLTVLAVLTAIALDRGRRLAMLVLILPSCALTVLVLAGGWQFFAATDRVAGIQGRYLAGGLAGLTLVALTGAARLAPRIRSWLPLAVFAFAVAMQALNAGYITGLRWAPEGSGVSSIPDTLRAIVDWYPAPAAVLLLVVAGTFAVGLGTTVTLARAAAATHAPTPATRK